MTDVRNDIALAGSRFGFSGDSIISCKVIEQAINRLNRGKSEGIGGLKRNHFIMEGMT